MLKSENMSRMTISGHKQNLSDLSNLLDKHQLIHLIDYNNEDDGFEIGSSLTYGAQTSELLVKIDKLYNKGISGLDIINYITKFFPETVQKYKILLTFNKVKKDIRNEKLLMFFILSFSFIRSDYNLENITFM